MKLWHIVAIVAAGILFGFLEPGRFEYALGHATLYLFLPPLLFEAAWNVNARALKRFWPAIALLAGPGVLITAGIVAAVLVAVHVPLATALLVGAILSATDPIAVIAVFRRIRVPLALATIVECEALFNDAVAVVLYRAILASAALAAGVRGIAFDAALSMAGAAGGIACGVAFAFLVARLLRERSSVAAQALGTLACAYGAYFVADAWQLSGVFATIASGIALRTFERTQVRFGIADELNRIWELAALCANVVVFFMVGAALQVRYLARDPAFAVAALIGVVLARYALSALLAPTSFPRRWLGVIRVAGLRSALSLALALALPATTPYRDAIIGATFAVVLGMLVFAGSAIPAAIARAKRE